MTDHDPPITHTMLYLGTEKSSGAKIMIGSSDGRTYHGQKGNGVSVFDFTMPRTPNAGDQRTTFIGYARIPGLRDWARSCQRQRIRLGFLRVPT